MTGAGTAGSAGVYLRPAGVPDERADAVRAILTELWGGPVTVMPAGAASAAIAAALRAGGGLAFHSSGTTNASTCAVFDAATRRRHVAAVLATVGLTDDLTWCAMPAPGYAYGLSIVETHAAAGIEVTFLPRQDQARQLATFAATARWPLGLYLTPQALPVLLAAGLPAEAVRRVVVAGGRLSDAGARALTARFPGVDLTNMYGQAELGPRIATWRGPAAEFVAGDVGQPLPGVGITITPRADVGAGADVVPPVPPAPGAPGRILVTSQLAATFLIKDPAAGPQPQPATVDTGDLGRYDERGHLIHCGRGDHILNVAGTKVDVEEMRRTLEEALQPIAVRIAHRPALVAGDVVPMVQVVAAAEAPLHARDVRRALHGTVGSIAALCDVRVVEALTVGESGK
ncbi:MAG: AMP-binding protein [Austwickia sp.]|nr:AMP-binding protein [Actinomycetota bacterium]MCB1254600.1 AMP-binding protein [Austwickia sp.]MCO5310775.1 AMP-binding protein [Austwickia sp.]